MTLTRIGIYLMLRRSILTKIANKVNEKTSSYGFFPYKTWGALKMRRTIREEHRLFQALASTSSNPFLFPEGRFFPCYSDRYEEAGESTGHYFHQDLLVAQDIFLRSPDEHYDVGSSLAGFVSHVASYRKIHVIDIRPLESEIPNVYFHQADVMNLKSEFHNITGSLSCLHALEHFGLGRYGDRLDFDGWRKGLAGLKTMLRPEGILYLSVPTGYRQRYEFNAHRVFSLPFLRDELLKDFRIISASFVLDDGNLVRDIDFHGPLADSSFDSDYGCSIWILQNTK